MDEGRGKGEREGWREGGRGREGMGNEGVKEGGRTGWRQEKGSVWLAIVVNSMLEAKTLLFLIGTDI